MAIMKKTTHRMPALFAVAVMVLALAGCGSENAANVDENIGDTQLEAENTEGAEGTFLEGEDLEETTEIDAETVESTETESPEEDVIESTEAEDTEAEAEATDDDAGYTYTDLSATMYAKSSVNVRDLPSTSGNKLGSLSTNEEVTVTGKCNETNWYRIAYNNDTAYVSDKYLSDSKAAENKVENREETVADTSADDNTLQLYTDDNAIQQYPDDNQDESPAALDENSSVSTPAEPANGYDRAMAQEIWGYVNAERTAAGLNALEWDEDIYNFACQRAQAIVTDFSHNGHGNYGENILSRPFSMTSSAYDLHMQWYNSQGHHDNYMYSKYTSGACAVYYYDGTYYGVEDFYMPGAISFD
jgi:uncharacterized protein YgiM (DUF1202 family)